MSFASLDDALFGDAEESDINLCAAPDYVTDAEFLKYTAENNI